jgi:hypothetical protein
LVAKVVLNGETKKIDLELYAPAQGAAGSYMHTSWGP